MDKIIAGAVVLYNPTTEHIANIRTYCASVGKLFIVDNSEQPSSEIVETILNELLNVEYIAFHQNLGIAKALNEAAQKACEEGFEWLLTMDQDSRASSGMVEKLFEVVTNADQARIGIVAPQYIEETASAIEPPQLEEALTTITSGNIVSLSAFSDIGPFREELFIDFVDIDYCLRLNLKGYKVFINNKVKLEHRLGNASCHTFLGRRLCTSNHNHIRRYYITRNRLTILKEYKSSCPRYYQTEKDKNLIEITKLLLFEKDKVKKIKSILKGYIDFKRKRFGKYQ